MCHSIESTSAILRVLRVGGANRGASCGIMCVRLQNMSQISTKEEPRKKDLRQRPVVNCWVSPDSFLTPRQQQRWLGVEVTSLVMILHHNRSRLCKCCLQLTMVTKFQGWPYQRTQFLGTRACASPEPEVESEVDFPGS